MGVQAVIGQNNGLGILELGKNLRFKDEVALQVVALACPDSGPVRGRLAGEDAHAGILPVLRETVVELELFFLAAEFAGRPRAEIIAWNNKERDLRLSDLPAETQEFMEDYIAEFIPRNRVVYHWFDVYDLEEERL